MTELATVLSNQAKILANQGKLRRSCLTRDEGLERPLRHVGVLLLGWALA